MRLYHAVPHDQFGSRLYPLETLRSLAPDAYLEAVAKYQDDPRRANIPSRRIAKLDCTTAEAINLSPVDPRLIHRAWRDLGVDVGSAHWYAIPVDRVRTLPTVITRPDRMCTVGADIADDAVDWFDPDEYRELDRLPERTTAWYRKLASSERQGGWFVGIPHVLVKGPIDVSGLPTIDWSEGAAADPIHPLTGR